MKRLLIITLLGISSIFSYAGDKPSDKNLQSWHKGIVVFHSGDTIHCRLQFTRKVEEGLLQVMKGDQIGILTVKDVKAFSYFDEKKNQVRRFVTLSLMPELSTRNHEIFIEHLYSNARLSILNHRMLGFSAHAFQINPFRTKTVVNKQYLLDNATGTVLPMSKENILSLMKSEQKEILRYIQSNGIRLKSVADFKSLLDYHQSLL
jgi:hypothetical protein